MFRFLANRVGQSLLLLAIVSVIGFFILQMSPGGPLSRFAFTPGMTQEELARIATQMGFDRPLIPRYFEWLGGILTGDWGTSYRDGRPVLTVIRDHLGATLLLTVTAAVIAVVLGGTIGMASAMRRNSLFDYVSSTAAIVILSIPTFWLGLVAIYAFSVNLQWLPAGNMTTQGDGSFIDLLRHLALPALVLALVDVAIWSRYMRSATAEVLNQDFIKTARVKGVGIMRLMRKHVFRNAVLPVVPLLGMQLPSLLGGAAVTETVFTWPGMGRLFLDSLSNSDYPVALGILMFSATLVVVGSLLADVLVAVIDPRVRLG